MENKPSFLRMLFIGHRQVRLDWASIGREHALKRPFGGAHQVRKLIGSGVGSIRHGTRHMP